MARQVLENGVILPAEYSDDWYDDMTSNLTKLDDVIGSDSEKLSSADVGAAALSNNYNDLDNLPTIPTVNDATLTIQKNGVDVQTFTANASSNVTCNITVPTKVSELSNDSGFLTSADCLPIGSYIQFAGSQAPEGFLVCNGGEISRTTYSELFAVIGTTYGSGDGSTTFNLPDLTDRFLQGSTTSGTVKDAGLPDIKGSFDYNCTGTTKDVTTIGAISCSSGSINAEVTGTSGGIKLYVNTLTFNASDSSSIYNNDATVQPPALTCLICIKY
jgi:Microcystin-dependent protein